MFGPHEGKQYESEGGSQGAGRPHAVYPQTRAPPKGQGEAPAAPDAIKYLMDFDSNFFMSPQLAKSASGQIGCLLLPIKAHKLCPQIPLNGISVFRECVCACE